MAADVALIRNISPELSGETDDRINLFLTIASSQVNASAWTDKADTAVGLLTCHLITLANRQGKGAVTSERVGDIQLSYANRQSNGATDDEELKQTSYGSMYLTLRSSLGLSAMVLC